jgi:anti-sigma regulatory factor (Ser/Thr protein kinase)
MTGARRDGHVVFQREYEGVTSVLRAARSDLMDCLGASGFDEDLRDRAQLVLSELATNAVEASPGSPFVVRLKIDEGTSLVVEVTSRTNAGAPPARESWGPATALAARGRGLLIVEKLSSEVVVDQPTTGTVVVTAKLRSATIDRFSDLTAG